MEFPPLPLLSYWPWAILMFMLFLAFIFNKTTTNGRRLQPNQPPGPRKWPIIGNLNLIGELPHRSIHKLSKQYGSLMQLHFGSTSPVVVASSVAMARLFLTTHDLAFSDRPKIAFGKNVAYNYSDITWSPYGPYWRQARKMCIAQLFTHRSLDSYEHIRVIELRGLLHCLFVAAEKPVIVKDHLSTLSLNIIGRMVLGCRCNLEGFKRMLDELFFLNGVLNIGDSIPWLNFLDLQGYVCRMKSISRKIDRFLERVLDEHVGRRTEEGENFSPRDMVDVLIQFEENPTHDIKLNKSNIKALALDLITAGIEGSAVTVEWAISELMRKPHMMKKAIEELDRVIGRERWVKEKDAQNLPYIEAIIKETMRLHPLDPMLVPRQSREDVVIDGYDIPAGTGILVNIFSISRDPSIWEEPNEFCPERFVDRKIDVVGRDFELLPFGSGRRMCPGYRLGLKVVQSSLANMLHGFNWCLQDGMKAEELNMDEITGFSTTRKVPLVVIAKPRLSTQFYEMCS